MIHLPAFPTNELHTYGGVPSFFEDWPVASIKYHWGRLCEAQPASTQWPTPVHDTAFAYSWILENLAPPKPERRDIYVYGSYLGASLATSLALTESHGHSRFGVRGVAAYNGVYNWTMFLPQHPIHKQKKRKAKILDALKSAPLAEGAHLGDLRDSAPDWFKSPVNLFDPFASPSLFFHNPGLHVPRTFDADSSPVSDLLSLLAAEETANKLEEPPKPPRKSHLVFPPRVSTLKIPETLLLHDTPPPPAVKSRRGTKHRGHTFKTQAEELADLMRRSIDKVELKERSKWDDDIDSWEAEALRRVQVAELGEEMDGYSLSAAGEDELRIWLEDRTQ